MLCTVGTQGWVLMNLNEHLNLFSMFYLFFRVWGVNWIDSGDTCTSQEQYGDLLFWLSSCYGAVHYWFHFSSLLLPLTFAFALYLFLLSRSLFPSTSSLLALIEKQQVVFNIIPTLRDTSYSRLWMSLRYFAIWHCCHLQNAFVLVLVEPWIMLSASSSLRLSGYGSISELLTKQSQNTYS